MRTIRALGGFFGFALALLPSLAAALDGTNDAPMQLTPSEAFRAGAKAYYAGDKDTALPSLQSAAEQGHAMAQWKLARMYAEGDGVSEDHLKAFEYFSELADAHADDNPQTPRARFVANAFVALGSYYLDGIPQTDVVPDPRRAFDMFTYAATYFGDPDAQYRLGRMYLDTPGIRKDAVQGARWLQLAAKKGHTQAQALLGEMLFRGGDLPKKPIQGLMWLELARKTASTTEDQWIFLAHEHAFAEAKPTERERALELVEKHAASHGREQAGRPEGRR